MSGLDAQMDAIFAARDREHMQPTIEAFALLLTTIADHLESPEIARYEASIRGTAEHIRSLGGA